MENENNTQINQPEMPETVNEIQPETKGKSCPFRPSTVINVILFIAIGVLYFLHFYSGKPANTAASVSNGPLKIAYFDIDTVSQNYEKATQLHENLKKEKDSLEGIVIAKQRVLQQKYQNYQTNLNNNVITPAQAQNAENQLVKERDVIMKINDEYSQKLMLKQDENSRLIWNEIIGYTNKFNEKYGADYIFLSTNSIGGSLIVANPKFNVTKDILEGLNKEYNEKKGK